VRDRGDHERNIHKSTSNYDASSFYTKTLLMDTEQGLLAIADKQTPT
jgi:hypothetical protein